MKTMQPQEWVFLNRLIYEIHTMPDPDKMRAQFLTDLHVLLDYDCAEFHLVDASATDRVHFVRPVLDHCDQDYSRIYEELDYATDLLAAGKTMIYKDSDYLQEAERTRTDYYRKVYQPNKWHYSLQMILAYDHHLVGAATFYRYVGKDDFVYDDIFLLDQLKDHMAWRLGHETRRGSAVTGKLTVTQAAEQYALTRQEGVVLRLIMDGLENEEIADRLSITTNTLKKHTLNIYRKLNVSSRTQLFKMVREAE